MTPVQVFSCEFSKIFKNIYFAEHLGTAASGFSEVFFKKKKYSKFLYHSKKVSTAESDLSKVALATLL